ncbi:hypothetical protein EIP91_002772 [Steccherinum ochraceum]|uniref:Protein kinase domain-containing protein n=1 Tax=Steccherinum ochraceum TaxID=92696 RepID=A0A4R0RS79_9APHY|nr:hypothetical protein EIP91_002772 [Steccherinum ochraceum]
MPSTPTVKTPAVKAPEAILSLTSEMLLDSEKIVGNDCNIIGLDKSREFRDNLNQARITQEDLLSRVREALKDPAVRSYLTDLNLRGYIEHRQKYKQLRSESRQHLKNIQELYDTIQTTSARGRMDTRIAEMEARLAEEQRQEKVIEEQQIRQRRKGEATVVPLVRAFENLLATSQNATRCSIFPSLAFVSLALMATTEPVPSAGDGPSVDTSGLNENEIFWRDLVPYLMEKGYKLRPRYQADWVPSWKARGERPSNLRHEDFPGLARPGVLDAVRISDGEMVFLKRISSKTHEREKEMTMMWSAEPLSSDPRNHCVPVLDVLDLPGSSEETLLVLPLLRLFSDPAFLTVGEAMEFFRQAFEGLAFMHELHVSHGDCTNLNIMMDPRPTFPQMYHPRMVHQPRDFKGELKYSRRTKHPVKYYWIDFGLSCKYDTDNTSPRDVPIFGGYRDAPEYQDPAMPSNPFHTDVWFIGRTIQKKFLQEMLGVEFMTPLVSDMMHNDPEKRPTMKEVVARFEQLQRSLPWWKLRSRITYIQDGENTREWITNSVHHALRTAFDMLLLRPALPRPPSRPLHTFKV